MARLLADAAEIFQRFHNSRSEKLFPITVYRDSGRQRLTWSKKPVGECQPVARSTCRKLRKNGGNVRNKICTNFCQKVPPLKFPGGSLFVRLFLGHHRNVYRRDLGDSFFEILKACDCGYPIGFCAKGGPAGIAAQREADTPNNCRPRINLAQLL